MNEEVAQEILEELFSSLKSVETQTGAILQFLNDKGLAKQEELAPYIQRAGEASGVRLRAARARIEYLLSSAMKSDEGNAKKEPQKTEEPAGKDAGQHSDNGGPEELQAGGTEKEDGEAKTVQKAATDGEPQAENVDVAAKKEDKREHEESGRGESGRKKAGENNRDAATPNKGVPDTAEKAA
jgi:hypothetical protein